MLNEKGVQSRAVLHPVSNFIVKSTWLYYKETESRQRIFQLIHLSARCYRITEFKSRGDDPVILFELLHAVSPYISLP